MTQENKELLLKDLCSRLHYGVKVQSYRYGEDVETIETLWTIDSDGYISTLECDTLKNIYKPYLFPLSSMTEEQLIIYGDFCYAVIHSLAWDTQAALDELFDWLNKNQFDHRGLITMGLAIDATNLGIY